jgi:hypothetical protein
MKTSNIPFPLTAFAVLVFCFSFLPDSTAFAGMKNQVCINYTLEAKWHPEGIFQKTFKSTRITDCPTQVKFPPKKGQETQIELLQIQIALIFTPSL